MPLKSLPFDLPLAEPLLTLEKNRQVTFVNLANATAKSYLVSELQKKTKFKNIFWASSDEKGEEIAAAAELFFDGDIIEIKSTVSPREFYSIKKSLEKPTSLLLLFENYEAIQTAQFPAWDILTEPAITIESGRTIRIFNVFAQLESIGYASAKENILVPGEFHRRGDNLFIYPTNQKTCYRIELFGDTVETITTYDQANKKDETVVAHLTILPHEFGNKCTKNIFEALLTDPAMSQKSVFLSDDLDTDELPQFDFSLVKFTSFPQEDEPFFHLNFFSVLPYYTIPDFVVDIKERLRRQYDIVIATKKWTEIEKIFLEYNVLYTRDLTSQNPSTVKVIEFDEGGFLPHSFQNNQENLLLLTDREIFAFHRSSRQRKAISGMNMELMNSLKAGDFVVHLEHGLAEFGGIVRRDLGEDFGTKEYLKLSYAGNDKLYVPVESAEKITKFIGDDVPKLTKLDSSDWQRKQERIKKETERIAKDLLKLYAARELAKGKAFLDDNDKMQDFCASFPYELTPGQRQAWDDVRRDLEHHQPMDRLVCGDVGFGKTEIAMRAAFKAFCSGQQAAILAPITILAEQHYQSFMKRVADKSYGVRIELLSRFQTKAEQTKILKDLKNGLVDIVIGTHRLLSGDIQFKNLGIIIIDEEQRFGVQQKEKLKELRAGVHTLTMTATPIPRTLNMSLNKLKDISTITTPPPGRLPVVTEVRKYNLNLIREKVLEEVQRGGQVYILHNEVRTIEGFTHQLQTLMPEVRFIIGHGQLKPEELEKRIKSFKRHEADVLVASTIIENGIDLPNANTLFVNRAEKFGLAQLYQLRGRVGRGRTQAYAYFLYHGQKLAIEAKKRLRAIVEASELGSGFQIAMRDLEIRGAGEVLGINQAGTMKTVGVGHFMRMLAKTVEEMRTGEESSNNEPEENVTVEIPLSAYIPTAYIPNVNEKIRVYQELSAAADEEHLLQIRQELKEDYGKIPFEVDNLCKVIALKLLLRDVNLEGLKINRNSHRDYEIVLRMGKHFTPEQIFGLIKDGKNQWTVTAKALKLKMNTLPVTWYKDLRFDIECLRVDKKKGQSK